MLYGGQALIPANGGVHVKFPAKQALIAFEHRRLVVDKKNPFRHRLFTSARPMRLAASTPQPLARENGIDGSIADSARVSKAVIGNPGREDEQRPGEKALRRISPE